MPNLPRRIDRCQHEQFFEFEQTLGCDSRKATDEPRQPMRIAYPLTHFPVQSTVKQTLKFLRGRVNLRLPPPSFRRRKRAHRSRLHVFPCVTRTARRRRTDGLIDVMGWFPWDDTPPDAGAPVDEDTYVVTYCRN